MRHVSKVFALALAIFAISACVTQKKKGDTTWLKKRYHNMTSKYNGYFNANVLYDESLDQLTAAKQDNYNQLLDVYPYITDDGKAVAGNMDIAIKKLATVVNNHRSGDWTDDCYLLFTKCQYLKKDYESAEETARYALEEFNPDNVLKRKKLAKGKKSKKEKASDSKKKKAEAKKKSEAKKKAAQKKSKQNSKKKKSSSKGKSSKDIKTSKSTEKDEKTNKTDSKKEKEEAETADETVEKYILDGAKNPNASSVFKRRPAYPELQLWLGRIHTERLQFDQAEFIFSQLETDPFFPKPLFDDLATARAHNFLKSKNYARAIPQLEMAIGFTKKKATRARLSFVLAQLYQKAGRSEDAVAAFAAAKKNATNYDMSFAAQLNQLLDSHATGKTSDDEATSSLKKMLKEDKNLDYRDQIYFALGQLDLKKGNDVAAIENFQKGLAASSKNKSQKAEMYLAVANLFLKKERFVEAKAYFDSTLTILPTTDLRHPEITTLAKNLTDVAAFLAVVTMNDSLRTIYAMSPEAKKALAKKIKADREKALAAASIKTDDAVSGAPKSSLPRSLPGGLGLPPIGDPGGRTAPSSFYFYSDASLKKGKKDFQKTWGDRKNEDNWHRSLRKPDALAAAGDDPAATAGDDPSKKETDISSEEIGSYLPAGIPKNEAELAALDSVTSVNLFKLGKAYRDQLENNAQCIRALERYQNEFSKYFGITELETWFYCYLAAKDLGDEARVKLYNEKLQAKYPTTTFARSIIDPNFHALIAAKERDLSKFYQETFANYEAHEYQKAFDRCSEAERKYGSTNVLMPKFSLLAAMCQGSLIGKQAYCTALKDLMAKYPDSDEKKRATEIARLIGCDGFLGLPNPDEKKPDEGGKPGEAYTSEDDKLHYFLIVFSGNDDLKLDNIKADISDYNRQYHKLEQIRVSNIFLGSDTSTPIIVLRKFDNKASAMKYYDEITKATDFIKNKKAKADFFAITQNNYRVLLGKKEMEAYRGFFEANYRK